MMKNKKAWLRIVEAVMAVLIIGSVLIIIALITPEKSDREVEIYEMQRLILKQISSNNSLRGEVLIEKTTNIKKFIEDRVPVSWNFTVRVCEIEESCGMPLEIEKQIYADEILITSNLTNYNPKKLKLFVWVKG